MGERRRLLLRLTPTSDLMISLQPIDRGLIWDPTTNTLDPRWISFRLSAYRYTSSASYPLPFGISLFSNDYTVQAVLTGLFYFKFSKYLTIDLV